MADAVGVAGGSGAWLRRGTVAALLLIHTALLAVSAALHSPVVDETAHLPAGLAWLTLGRTDIYTQNPPLVKTVAAVPVAIAGYRPRWGLIDELPVSRPEFGLGRELIEENGRRSFWLFTLARWACIPFSLVGGWVVYRWSRGLWGDMAGLVSLSLWCFCPNVIGNGATILPDAPATSCGVLASYAFWRWLRSFTWRWTALAGIAIGLALLAKFTWLVLFALWPLLWLAWAAFGWMSNQQSAAESQSSSRIVRQMTQLALILGWFALNAAYRFRGTFTPLATPRYYSRALSGEDFPLGVRAAGQNRFHDSPLAQLPVPLPRDVLRGIDLQKHDFEREFVGFLAGEWRKGGWWYYYLYGLGFKTPLGTLLLVGLAGAVTLAGVWPSSGVGRGHGGLVRTADPTRGELRDELVLLAPAAAVLLLVSSQTGINLFMRYALPVYPFLFIWAGKGVAAVERWGWRGRMLWAVPLGWSIASSLAVYPHSASYFNELAGGPLGGPDHLLDSNVGWGQDLLFLKRWVDQHPEARPLGLVYFGNFDARVAGLEFHLPPRGPRSANLQCAAPAAEQGPVPGWFAVDVSFVRGLNRRVLDGQARWTPPEPNCDFSYFSRFEPVARAGYSIYLYKITHEQANAVRRELGLPNLAGD